MSACGDNLLLLHGMLDGELDAANTLVCEAHMRNCAECATQFEHLETLRRRIRSPGVRFEAPAQLRERVVIALRAADPHNSRAADAARVPVRRSRRVFTPWFLGGSLAAVAACVAFVLFVRPPFQGMADELVAGHVRSLLATHITDVATSDRHVVKPWFAGKVDFSPPVFELADAGFPLVGGRLDYIQDRVVAAVVYRRRQHVINLFVWPAGSRDSPLAAAARREGYNLVGWQQGGLQFWAVSDVDASELQQLRALFAARGNL